MKLSLGEHFEWLTLWRVKRGGVTREQGGGLVDFGQPLGSFVVQVLTELIDEGLLEVGDTSPQGLAEVRHTDAGRARYAQLCRQQRRKTYSQTELPSRPKRLALCHIAASWTRGCVLL